MKLPTWLDGFTSRYGIGLNELIWRLASFLGTTLFLAGVVDAYILLVRTESIFLRAWAVSLITPVYFMLMFIAMIRQIEQPRIVARLSNLELDFDQHVTRGRRG